MSATILLAEDECSLRELILIALTDAGFSVVQAGDGQEAMEKLAENADRLDALITDIRLGPGPDGWDLGRAARRVRRFLPILYMSGDGLHEWPEQGVAGSVFLPKPFRVLRLVDRVEALFSRVTDGFLLPELPRDGADVR